MPDLFIFIGLVVCVLIFFTMLVSGEITPILISLCIGIILGSWIIFAECFISPMTLNETSTVKIVDNVPIVVFRNGTLIKNCNKLFDVQVKEGDSVELWYRSSEFSCGVLMVTRCDPEFKLAEKTR